MSGTDAGAGAGGDAGRTAYLAELAAALRETGLPDERIEATLADLGTHLEQTGADPEEEFGPAGEFAAALAPDDGGAEAESPVETWRWVADTYADEPLLNRFGADGWEVERIDGLGRFVSRRDTERPQRWEYRRELVSVLGREGLDERLAPDGWEACGNWLVYAWFKRPVAASEGPEAELPAPPPRPAAGRHTFLTRRFLTTLAVSAVVLVAAGVIAAVVEGDAASGLGFAGGLLAGALLPLAAIAVTAVLARRSDRARERSDADAL
ncbi:hypothetical protein ACIBI4_17955 [Streptomyces sp. NPDC050418]|uniref:hypothetical protein n=1 Tax=Streptomyces sp. NPDC050418 TaxID=3365612 RepID=UPI0037AAC5C2